jgi:hypothetical protein
LILVFEDASQKKDIAARVENFANELSLKADVIVCSRPELEKEKQKPWSFLAVVHKAGKVVYENGIKTIDFS